MLNEDKIKLMTKIALYEQGEGAESIKSNKYYKKDYVGVKMINTAITITFAYILCILLWGIYKVDYLIDNIVSISITSLGKKLLFIYIIIFVIYLLIAYMVYSLEYLKMQEDNLGYIEDLKKLYMFYRKEEKIKSANKTEGDNSDDEYFDI